MKNGRPAPRGAWGPFLPLLILLLSALAWFGVQVQHLHVLHNSLATARDGQEAALQQAQRMREALDTLSARTQRLAEAGNANARLVLDELRRRGITIDALTPALPAPTSPASKP